MNTQLINTVGHARVKYIYQYYWGFVVARYSVKGHSNICEARLASRMVGEAKRSSPRLASPSPMCEWSREYKRRDDDFKL